MAVPAAVKLAMCVVGIFGSFSYFAILQEDLFKKTYADQKFKSTFFMMVAERALNGLVGFLFMMILGTSGLKIPVNQIFVSGGTQMFAMALSNEALRYVSYPTQVLGKSCKMVPVFLMGLVMTKKKSSITEFITVATVTVGVVVFNFAAPVKPGKAGGSDSTYGLALIVVSLILDGLTGGIQDRVKEAINELNPTKEGEKPKKMTSFENMFYTNIAGAVVALILCIGSGQMADGLALCTASPDFVKALLLFGLSSSVGQCFIYYTIAEFSPLLLSTVTTTRKIFSTVYSVFRSPDNSLNKEQWFGCCLVFAGILGEMVAKQFHSKPKDGKKKE
mmetsp:Transcript_41142/g.96738  ORF Transcript_41142/g.96738 Transcript_41142/m.96738 type:complete len:333 (+) Transcript_41142:100-1098(+)